MKTPAAVQIARDDGSVLQGFPGRLEQQPLLRVHRQRLTRADTEELRVEPGGSSYEVPLHRIRLAVRLGVGVVQVVGPASVVREAGDALPALAHELPQRLR
jgi:hypothetical protein